MTEKNGEVLVSVYCMTYNQAETVAQTIKGIISQQTDFVFELIIHDDASTDGTADIVREYAAKYPNIIRTVLQKENQFFNCNIYKEFINPIAKGRYVAVCEGDDYWTDPEKLSIQAEYMSNHPECAMCFHAVEQLSGNGEITAVRPLKKSGVAQTELIIKRGGLFCPTVSLMFRRDVVESWPRFRDMADVYDYPLQILAAHMGSVYYIDKIMGVYRFAVNGSWTAQRQNGTDFKYLENETSWIKEFDKFTDHRYKNAVNYHLAHLHLTEYRKSFDKSVKLKTKEYIKLLPLKSRIIFNMLLMMFSVLGSKGNTVYKKIKKFLLK